MASNPNPPAEQWAQPPQKQAALSECNVCGVSMAGLDPYGHSLVHFPEEPMPRMPGTLAARKQQAVLLGKPEPED